MPLFLQSPNGGRQLRRRGFSLVELLVVVAILVILASIFVPYFSKIRETDRRVRCADNLRAIMEGLHQYAMLKSRGTATHAYPRTLADVKSNGYTAYTGADAPNPFAQGGVGNNDVTASLWLMVRLGFVPPLRFICPSTSNSVDPMIGPNGVAAAPSARSNFTNGSHLSYSYASPFSTAPGYKMDDDSHVADFALMADKNPGDLAKFGGTRPRCDDKNPFTLSLANSSNHGKVGQNVLYADGHVQFQSTAYCGFGRDARRDDIFTALAATPLLPGQHPPVENEGVLGRDVGPSWTNDSYLVPTEGE